MTRVAVLAAIASSLLAAAVGVIHGTRAVGGSDSSCYGLMAQSFAQLDWQPRSELARTAPWPSALLTSTPAGFIPSPLAPDAASPVCAPGFAVLAAPLMALAGPDALFWVSPAFGAVLVLAAFLAARRLGGALAGITAAVLTATTPIVLFQVVQPMNDVASAALWMTAVAFLIAPGRPMTLLAGLCTGAALLVRPNLLPAGVVLGLAVLAWQGWRAAIRFGMAVLPGGVAVLGLNAVLYGGPFGSGYGSAAELFAVDHMPVNLLAHGRALVVTQGGWPLLGVLAPLVLPPALRRSAWTMLSVATALTLCYLPYRPYPEWWYLRFLLPAIVLLMVLASAMLAHLTSLASWRRLAAAGLMGVVLLTGVLQWRAARHHQAFTLRELERHFRLAAETVRDRLPAGAVAITVWDSGSVRFHGGREVVLWDALDPEALDLAIAWLSEQGFTPVVLVERWEEAAFRARFASQRHGGLDWPPRFDIDSRVRAFLPADRDSYLAGEAVPTETIWPR